MSEIILSLELISLYILIVNFQHKPSLHSQLELIYKYIERTKSILTKIKAKK